MKQLIGIQGKAGSYHETATLQMHPEVSLQYYETFTTLFDALVNGVVSSVVVAIANNRVQFIPEPYERLTGSDHGMVIIGETYLRVEHALLAPHGAMIETITEVHSQAPAIGQCRQFLETILPHAKIIEQHDTAGSAELVSQWNDTSKAAIASVGAGMLNGLSVMQQRIQDDPDNITRFIEVALKAQAPELLETSKTTLLLHTPQVAGALVGALLPFKEYDINLCALQSRLLPNTAFDMMFFIEFEAGLAEQRTKQVLQRLEEDGYYIDVLGSYKSALIPIDSKTRWQQ